MILNTNGAVEQRLVEHAKRRGEGANEESVAVDVGIAAAAAAGTVARSHSKRVLAHARWDRGLASDVRGWLARERRRLRRPTVTYARHGKLGSARIRVGLLCYSIAIAGECRRGVSYQRVGGDRPLVAVGDGARVFSGSGSGRSAPEAARALQPDVAAQAADGVVGSALVPATTASISAHIAGAAIALVPLSEPQLERARRRRRVERVWVHRRRHRHARRRARYALGEEGSRRSCCLCAARYRRADSRTIVAFPSGGPRGAEQHALERR